MENRARREAASRRANPRNPQVPLMVWMVRKIRARISREDGVFFAAQDADSEGEEGTFFVWKPEQGMKFLIIDKDDLKKTRWAQGPARAFYHTGAAWEESDGTIRLDAAFYPEPVLGSGGGAAEIRGKFAGDHVSSKLTQAVIPTSGDAKMIETRIAGDFPQVDPRRHGLSRKLTAMITGSVAGQPGGSALALQDWSSGKAQIYDFGSKYMVEEHLFVPKGTGSAETDCWLIGTAINVRAGKSEVWVFDASNIEDGPVAVWQADYAWPLGFHGTWSA
mgnify:CR=1 FL=1